MTCLPSAPVPFRFHETAISFAENRRDPVVSRHQALVITDSEGKLAGIITRATSFVPWKGIQLSR